jgi:branched-chain amino acid transport system substrate-binding protein
MLRSIIILLMLLWPAYGAQGAEPITIGVSLGLTGQYSVMADMQKKGYELWEKEVNLRGGILGRKIKIIICDDRCEPKKAQELYRLLMNKNKVDFLFAPYSTQLTEAILPLTEKKEYLVLIGGAAGDTLWEQGYKYAVGVYTPSSKFIAGFYELLVKADLNNLGIIAANDLFSRDLAYSANIWAKRYGLKIVFASRLGKGTQDLEALSRRAREAGVKVLVLCGHFNAAVNMRRALKHIGWYPAAFYASVGAATPAFSQKLKGEANLVFSTSLWVPKANFPGSQRFLKEYQATYHETPGYHAALAYATGEVLEEAIKTAGSLNRAKVRASLFQMDSMTILGRYGVDSTGKQTRQQNFITQWQKGNLEIVWPDALKTASPIFASGGNK